MVSMSSCARRGSGHRGTLLFSCLLAEWHLAVGEVAEARTLFGELAASDFRALLPRDNEWLLNASIMADVCVALGDRERAEYLYQQLAPVAELHAVGVSELSRGSVQRNVGALAATLGRYDEAIDRLQRAVESNVAMHAEPWVIRARIDLAAALVACGGSGER